MKRNTLPDSSLQMENILDQKTKEVKELTDSAPHIRTKSLELKERALGMEGKRFHFRLRSDMIKKSEELMKKFEYYSSKTHEKEFEETIRPYILSNDMIDLRKRKKIRSTNHDTKGLDQFGVTEKSSKRAIVKDLMRILNLKQPQHSLITDDVCNLCGGDFYIVSSKSIMCCSNCGYSVSFLDATTSSMSFKEEVEFTSYSYQRINHFNEWLQHVQARENYEVPHQIVESVMQNLYENSIHPSSVTHQEVRKALKRLKFRKAYEYVVQITSKVTGNLPLRLPPDVEEKCRLMFLAVQSPFEKHCPPERKNFLSYSYIMYKFFELMGYKELLDSFSLLKGKDKLAKQDSIWQKICRELSWEFIPSI